MRKILTIVMATSVIVFLAACGADNSNNLVDQDGTNNTENSATDNDATNEETTNDNASNEKTSDENSTNDSEAKNNADDSDGDSMMDKMKAIAIEEIELEVEYADNKEYEIEIEKDSHSDEGYEAELDDDLNDEHLKGQEAFDKIYPMVKKLDIDENTSKDDAIKQVLKAFDLPEDYEEIEIEIDLWDFDHEIEFEEKK